MENNKYPWELIDTTNLMIPSEILVYHLYRYERLVKNKQIKEAIKEAEIIKSYIDKENKESEEKACLMQ